MRLLVVAFDAMTRFIEAKAVARCVERRCQCDRASPGEARHQPSAKKVDWIETASAIRTSLG